MSTVNVFRMRLQSYDGAAWRGRLPTKLAVSARYAH